MVSFGHTVKHIERKTQTHRMKSWTHALLLLAAIGKFWTDVSIGDGVVEKHVLI